MAGYAIDDGPVQLWQPHESPKAPTDLREALLDPAVEKRAWNSPFEEQLIAGVFKRPTYFWRDTMVRALYASLPAALAFAGPAIGLPEDECKMPQGKKLITLFCIPRADGGFNDHTTHPEQWEVFCDYCKRDVAVERKIAGKLANFQPPDSEWDLWRLDQEINRRGLPVDMLFVNNALAMAAEEKARLVTILKRETRLANPMTQANFLAFARQHGYPYGDLAKATVNRALAQGDLPKFLDRLLRLRADAGRTSTAKYQSIASKTIDGRIYNTMQFYGAARTGRWAGRDPQVQNFPRPSPDIEGHEIEATELIRDNQYDEILMRYGGAMTPLASLTRSSFRAPEGRTFMIADLNAIENRMLGWIADCQPILDVFRNNRDPYKDFGARMFRKPYDEITKPERTISKPAVLGCGYQLGGGAEVVNDNGDTIRTGLWGYAESMGIHMTKEQSHTSVKVFREAFPEVVQFWYALSDAAKEAVTNKCKTRVGRIVFEYKPGVLLLHLPSGRTLHYLKPRVEWQTRKLPDGETMRSLALTYEGMNSVKKWCRQTTHGGKLTENICQALSRDVLAAGLIAATDYGFDVILHAHDEIVTEVPLDSPLTLQNLIDCMTRDLPWADGLPLAAAGEVTPIYKK
jgi:DNA polymerase